MQVRGNNCDSAHIEKQDADVVSAATFIHVVICYVENFVCVHALFGCSQRPFSSYRLAVVLLPSLI